MFQRNSALPSWVVRYVELADQYNWDTLVAAGVSPEGIAHLVLVQVDPPLTIDDYERFIGAVRILPKSVWDVRAGSVP